MIVDDKEIEIKKFKMFAENVNSEQKIIELCKKYLKHKGIDIDTNAFVPPPPPQQIFINKEDVEFISYKMKIDDNMFFQNTMARMEMEAAIRKNIVESIMHELVMRNLIKFDTLKDHMNCQTMVNGKIGIWRGI